MQGETYIRQGRMEQSVDSLNEWVNKCDPHKDRELINMLYDKRYYLLNKIKYIQNYGEKTEKNAGTEHQHRTV